MRYTISFLALCTCTGAFRPPLASFGSALQRSRLSTMPLHVATRSTDLSEALRSDEAISDGAPALELAAQYPITSPALQELATAGITQAQWEALLSIGTVRLLEANQLLVEEGKLKTNVLTRGVYFVLSGSSQLEVKGESCAIFTSCSITACSTAR
jgi:hypothetical protein